MRMWAEWRICGRAPYRTKRERERGEQRRNNICTQWRRPSALTHGSRRATLCGLAGCDLPQAQKELFPLKSQLRHSLCQPNTPQSSCSTKPDKGCPASFLFLKC